MSTRLRGPQEWSLACGTPFMYFTVRYADVTPLNVLTCDLDPAVAHLATFDPFQHQTAETKRRFMPLEKQIRGRLCRTQHSCQRDPTGLLA